MFNMIFFLNFALVNTFLYIFSANPTTRFVTEKNKRFRKVGTTGPQKQTFQNRTTRRAKMRLVTDFLEITIQIS